MLDECVVNVVHEFLGVAHLLDIGKSFAAYSLHRSLQGGVTGVDDDLNLGIDLAEFLEEFNALPGTGGLGLREEDPASSPPDPDPTASFSSSATRA